MRLRAASIVVAAAVVLLLGVLLPCTEAEGWGSKRGSTTTKAERRQAARNKRRYGKACDACLACRRKQPLDRQATCDASCGECALGTTMPVVGGGGGGGGSLIGGGAPYAMNFETGVGTVSCYDISNTGGSGKCGSAMAYANTLPGIDFDAAIPLAYWPPGAGFYGNCADCGVRCSGPWGPSSVVAYDGAPLCYQITSHTTGVAKTIRVNDACGGNCPSPPGESVKSGASAQSWPSCGPITGGASQSFDCAVWATYYTEPRQIQTNLAYYGINQFRCPAAQECRQDWFNGAFPERTDPPCPSTNPPHDNWSDFCSGKYMHFDLVTQLQGGPTCSNQGGLIYAFCGDSGHCAVDYQRVPCPPP